MRRQIVPSVVALLALTLLVGVAYPLAMTAIAQVAFGEQADGSLVRDASGRVVGSALLAQGFTAEEYLHPRPSAAGDGYDGLASGASNLGPSNPELHRTVAERAAAYREVNGLADGVPVPVDAVTASGSGLDPHISVDNARLQAPRVAEARGVPVATVLAVIDDHTERRALALVGENAVDVLAVNLALDRLT